MIFPYNQKKKKKGGGEWKAKSGKLQSHDILVCFWSISLIYAASIAHDVKPLES